MDGTSTHRDKWCYLAAMISVLAVLGSRQSLAQTPQILDASVCNAALVPTIDVSRNNYRISQDYISQNAEYAFEQIQRNESRGEYGGALYDAFFAEYENSNSASEFAERIHARLARENYSFNSYDVATSYRRYLSDAQLGAWSECMKSYAGGGGVILQSNGIANNTLPIKAVWSPNLATGDRQGELVLLADNAKIKDPVSGRPISILTMPFDNVGAVDLILVPEANDRPILITANFLTKRLRNRFSDSLRIPRNYPAPIPLPSATDICPPTTLRAIKSAVIRITDVDLTARVRINGRELFPTGLGFGASVTQSFRDYLIVGSNEIQVQSDHPEGRGLVYGSYQLNNCAPVGIGGNALATTRTYNLPSPQKSIVYRPSGNPAQVTPLVLR